MRRWARARYGLPRAPHARSSALSVYVSGRTPCERICSISASTLVSSPGVRLRLGLGPGLAARVRARVRVRPQAQAQAQAQAPAALDELISLDARTLPCEAIHEDVEWHCSGGAARRIVRVEHLDRGCDPTARDEGGEHQRESPLLVSTKGRG